MNNQTQILYENQKPISLKCSCGAVYPFTSWVFAHWNILLTRECNFCKKIIAIQNGIVIKE